MVLEGVIYAWHRTAHNVGFLWRGFHQMHHSPRRVDIAGSLVFHPLEMVVQVLLQLGATVIVLGIDPLAAALVGYLIAFNGFFQHWNVRTPQWLGYLIQRPESHCVHHRMGVHYYNYSDFPPWDMLFGTFRNPAKFMGECGFEGGADLKLGSILAFADVNAARTAPAIWARSRGRPPPEPFSDGASAGGFSACRLVRFSRARMGWLRSLIQVAFPRVRTTPIRRIIDIPFPEVGP